MRPTEPFNPLLEFSLPIRPPTLSRGQIECCFSLVNRGTAQTELLALIVGLAPVATRGHRTKGRSRWPPSTELRRSRKSVNGGLVVGHSKLASFDHLVGACDQRRWDRGTQCFCSL